MKSVRVTDTKFEAVPPKEIRVYISVYKVSYTSYPIKVLQGVSRFASCYSDNIMMLDSLCQEVHSLFNKLLHILLQLIVALQLSV